MSIKVFEQGEFSIEITPPTEEIEQHIPTIQPSQLDIHYLYNKGLALSPIQPSECKAKNHLVASSLTPSILPKRHLKDPNESVKNKSFEEVWSYMLFKRRKQIN